MSLRAKTSLAAFDFDDGTLLLTEASSKKRASLHLVAGEAALAAFSRGGVEPLEAGEVAFTEALLRENHTLKRALTDPRLFSGIGNAYSDEILHRARLSPVKLTSRLTPEEASRLHAATVAVLASWTERFVADAARAFPEKVTAFREGMAVHGRYGKPCPDCGSPGAADRLRGERVELLRDVPDRRQAARRPRALATAARRLAEDAGRAGGTQEGLSVER